ncbi:uncharacterized protein METZ01_LOCUS408746, partial [marine metagenome]
KQVGLHLNRFRLVKNVQGVGA